MQLSWIEKTISTAQKNNERVILMCHQPVYSPNRPKSVLWNAEEVQTMLWKYDNVVAWFAGHDHQGEYALDPYGIHHIVFPAPIETDLSDDAFATIEVFKDRLHIIWDGKVPDNTHSPWPREIEFRRKVLM